MAHDRAAFLRYKFLFPLDYSGSRQASVQYRGAVQCEQVLVVAFNRWAKMLVSRRARTFESTVGVAFTGPIDNG